MALKHDHQRAAGDIGQRRERLRGDDGGGDGDGVDDIGYTHAGIPQMGRVEPLFRIRNVFAWIIKDKKNSMRYLKWHQSPAENHSSRLMHPSRKILDNSSIPIFSP